MRRPPSPRQMQIECDAFNASYPVGSTIRVAPGSIDGPFKAVQVCEPGAYLLSGHTAVVQVTGGHGCIALTHVKGPA